MMMAVNCKTEQSDTNKQRETKLERSTAFVGTQRKLQNKTACSRPLLEGGHRKPMDCVYYGDLQTAKFPKTSCGKREGRL